MNTLTLTVPCITQCTPIVIKVMCNYNRHVICRMTPVMDDIHNPNLYIPPQFCTLVSALFGLLTVFTQAAQLWANDLI